MARGERSVTNRVGRLAAAVVVVAMLMMPIPAGLQAQQVESLSGSILVTLEAPIGLQVGQDEKGYDRIRLPGFASAGSPGNPLLPYRVYNVALPPEGDWRDLKVRVVRAEVEDVPGTFTVAPAPPAATWDGGVQTLDWGLAADRIVAGRNIAVYEQDAYHPGAYVEVDGLSQMRKWRFVRLGYTPVQVNPVTGRLRVATRVEVELSFSREPTLVDKILLADTAMDDVAERILFNYQDARQWYAPLERGYAPQATNDYVIITTNDIESNSAKLSDFVTHKQSLGFNPLVITQDEYGGLTGQAPNGTAEKIRQWLMDNYATSGIEYVLLIGDPDPDDPSDGGDSVGDTPMKMCWPRNHETEYKESPTDYFYADLTGDWDLDGDLYFGEYQGDRGAGGVDWANEVYVGRIPVYSGECTGSDCSTLDGILQKIIDYETASGDLSWRKNALLPMAFSDASSDGANLGQHMKNNYLDPSGYSPYTLYQQNTGYACDSVHASDEPLVAGAVLSRWSANDYGLVTWKGHGSATATAVGYGGGDCEDGYILRSTDCPSLDDAHPSLVFQCSCSNGYPENAGNLGYALLKNGAVGTVSASRVSWYVVGVWSPSNKYLVDNASVAYYYGEKVVAEEAAGKALYHAKSDMGQNMGAALGGSSWMNLTDFNLYGDPSTGITATSDPVPVPGKEQVPLCLDDPETVTSSLDVDAPAAVPASASAKGGMGLVTPETATIESERELALEVFVEVEENEEVVATELSPPVAEKVEADSSIATPAGILAASAINNVEIGAGYVLPNDERYVSMDTDSEGNLYIVFDMQADGRSDHDLVLGKSTDNGFTWSIRFLNGSGNTDDRSPALALDDADYIWIAYQRDSGSGYRPAYWKSDSPQDIAGAFSGAYWSRLGVNHLAIDVLGSGSSALVYLMFEYPRDGYNEIYYGWSEDGGSSWDAWYYWNRDIDSYYPTVALSSYSGNHYVKMAWQEYSYGASSQIYHLQRLHGGSWTIGIYGGGTGYPDLTSSGSNVYLVYQQYVDSGDDDLLFRYSTDGGQVWPAAYWLAATAGVQERYPAVSASGSQPRVAYFYGSDAVYLELPYADYGAGWTGTPYQMDDISNTPNPQPRYLDVAYLVEKHPAVTWSADPSPSDSDNIYYSLLNDPPTAPAPSAPGDGTSCGFYAPTLSWTASTDADGDTVRYWWYVGTSNPPPSITGGPTTRTESLPFFTAPSTTYYWKVAADDGYVLRDDGGVWSFTTSVESCPGGAYDEDFASDPGTWTRKAYACLDCMEGDGLRWTVSPADKWTISTTYAKNGTHSVHSRYDANNADYRMTSPALDLRGTTWAYWEGYWRGSSESGDDYLYLESSPDGSSWTVGDRWSGDHDSAWGSHSIDVSDLAGSTTGQIRYRFATDGSGYGSSYGIGWYVDDAQVARASGWQHNGGGYYQMLSNGDGLSGYPNNTVDQLYSPFIELPSSTPSGDLYLRLRQRYTINSGDAVTVWIRDTAAETWLQLASFSGAKGNWGYRNVTIPGSYLGKTVVFALVLRSDAGGTLTGLLEEGGCWDLDGFGVGDTPLAVDLARFEASSERGGIRLTWETISEVDSLGFHVYRAESRAGPGERLTEAMIPIQAPGSPEGAVYTWLDEIIEHGITFYYWLEEVNVRGMAMRHGPVSATVGGRGRHPLPIRRGILVPRPGR